MSTEITKDSSHIGSLEESAHNPVYAAPGDGFSSKWFYFYRVKGHNDPVKAYRIKRDDTAYADARAEIDAIFEDIDQYAAFGSSMGDIAWRHKGYIVLVLEDSDEKITDVQFTRKSGGVNNSFLGGQNIASVAGEPEVSGFYCVNYMQSEAGGDLDEDKAEVFRVKVYHSSRAADGEISVLGHEDAGTNLGPPLPPP